MVPTADTFDVGVRWTRLSDGGYSLSASKPFSDASAEIMLGVNINDVLTSGRARSNERHSPQLHIEGERLYNMSPGLGMWVLGQGIRR
jgi:hypothetical protein